VKADRGGVLGFDAGDHEVLAERGGAPDQRPYELRPDALSAAVSAHVNRVLNGVAVPRPGTKVAEAGEPDNAARVAGDEHGIALLAARCEPALTVLEGHGLVAEDRRRERDDLVIDREHTRQIVVHRLTDGDALRAGYRVVALRSTHAPSVVVAQIGRAAVQPKM